MAYGGGVDTTVVDDPAAHRFELQVDGKPAGFAAYLDSFEGEGAH